MGKLCQLDTKEHLKIKLDTNASWFSWGEIIENELRLGFFYSVIMILSLLTWKRQKLSIKHSLP